jgi:hypothetical protein
MTTEDRFEVLEGGPSIEERDERLTEGAEELSTRRPSIFAHQRFVLTVAAVLMVLGLALILLGWIGAAHSTLIEEQVPYLISGGLLGLALGVIGGLTLFSHWLTVLIRESRQREASRQQDHQELMTTLRSLTEALTQEETTSNGRSRSGRGQRSVRGASRRS